MSQKISRQTVIRQVISSGNIESQEELLKHLFAEGHQVTQATLSRDLKAMNVAKIAYGDTYKYILPDPTINQLSTANKSSIFLADGLHSLAFSGNIAVIKTMPAFASGVAAYLDEARVKGVLGSVAGDDTVILVLHADCTAEEFKANLLCAMPTLKGKI